MAGLFHFNNRNQQFSDIPADLPIVPLRKEVVQLMNKDSLNVVSRLFRHNTTPQSEHGAYYGKLY